MIFINFSAGINQRTAATLMNFLAEKINIGEKEFYILISSPGGNVKDGIALHNYIKSLPVKIIMHNIGIIDSIANVVFLAGDERYAVPHSSFLFHGVGFTIEKARLEEKDLKEKLKIIERDQGLISQIIKERTRLSVEQIGEMFLEIQTKTPQEGKALGFIQEIKEVEIPRGIKIFSLR